MATLAQLGVSIDSGPAKQGSKEIREDLKGIATEAKATTQAVVAANKAVNDSMEAQVRAQNRARVEAQRAAAEKQKQAQAERALAEAAKRAAEEQERAAEKIAAAEEKKRRALASAEEQAYRMDAAMQKANAGFGLTEAGANRLRASVTGLLAPILQTTGSANVLASTLGSLAIGNAQTVAILAGIAAIGLAYDAIASGAAEATKRTNEAIKALDDLQKKQRQGATGDLPEQLRTITQARAQLQKDLAAAQANLAQLQQVGSATGAKTGISGADQQAAALAATQAKIKDLQDKIATGQREVVRILQETNRDYSSASTAQLADLVRNNAATVTEQRALRDRLKNLQGDLAKLTATGGDPAERQRIAADIATITSVYDAQAKATERATAATVKDQKEKDAWGKKVTAIFADVQRVIDESEAKQRDALDKRNKAITEGEGKVTDYIAAIERENDITREKIAQLKGEANAFDALTEAQAEAKAVAEALAKLPKGVLLDPDDEARLRAAVKERYNLNAALKDEEKVRKAIASYDGSNPFTLPKGAAEEAKKYTDALKSGLADALGIATQIANALGAGNEGQALRNGLSSALATFGGPGGRVAAQAIQLADALDLFGDRARERARQLQQLAEQFNASLDAFAIGKTTNLQSALRGNAAAATNLAQQAAAASGASFSGTFTSAADIDKQVAYLQSFADKNRLVREALGPFIERLKELAVITKANEEALRAQNAEEQATLTANLQVRRLAAAGLTDLADAERSRLAQLQEIKDAEDKFGADSPYVQALRDVQAAETAAAQAARQLAEAERARQEGYTVLDIDQRRNRLSGNTAAANEIGARATRNKALDEADALYTAGKISAETLRLLTGVINDEFNQALADFAEQSQRAARAQSDDLAVRQLAATGNSRAAEQARIDIANRKELEGVTDENLRSQILYVQGLEAEQRARADLADTQAIWADINERTIAALKVVNPQAAAVLEKQQQQVKRDIELANAKDEVIRQALRELYALEDQAAAAQVAADAAKAVTDALQAQADAMQKLAGLATDITDEYLRATGQTFEADRQALGRRRDERLGQIGSSVYAAAGPAPTINPNDPLSYIRFAQWQEKFTKLQADAQKLIDQVNATYDANLNKLIAAQMGPAAAPTNYSLGGGNTASARGSTDGGTVLGGDSVTFRGGNSITETSGMRLIDYAASQTALLREIRDALRGGRGTSDLLPSLARQLDRQYGRRASDQARMVFGEIA